MVFGEKIFYNIGTGNEIKQVFCQVEGYADFPPFGCRDSLRGGLFDAGGF